MYFQVLPPTPPRSTFLHSKLSSFSFRTAPIKDQLFPPRVLILDGQDPIYMAHVAEKFKLHNTIAYRTYSFIFQAEVDLKLSRGIPIFRVVLLFGVKIKAAGSNRILAVKNLWSPGIIPPTFIQLVFNFKSYLRQ